MLGWRPRRTPQRGGRSATGGTTERPVIRNIRLLGVALGGLVGLALARPAGLLSSTRPAGRRDAERRRVPDRLDRRLDGRRLRDPAVPDDRPGALALPRGPGALDRRVRDGGRRAAARPADGPAARPAAVAARGPARDVAAARRVAVPRARDARADRRQARGPAPRRRGDRARPPARARRAAAPRRRRPPHRRRHERDHRRPDRRDRRVRVHLRHARRPEVRPRGAPAHRRQLRHAPPQPRPARPRHPRPDAEGLVDAGRDRRRRRARTIAEVDAKLVALARARSKAILTNDFNLNRVAELQGDPGPQHQLARERREAGRPAGRGAPGPGHPGGQGGRARASGSSTTAR